MWIAEDWKDYELLDCGGGEKLERWDKQFLVRPEKSGLEAGKCPVSAQPDRRWTLGEKGVAGELESSL